MLMVDYTKEWASPMPIELRALLVTVSLVLTHNNNSVLPLGLRLSTSQEGRVAIKIKMNYTFSLVPLIHYLPSSTQ